MNTPKTSDAILADAMHLLAESIVSQDGVANAAIREAGDRILELSAIRCEFLSTLVERMKGNDMWSITGIVDAADVKGQRQDCDWFGHEYVDQHGPGIMGDDYSGDIFIPLEGRYLKLWYSC